VYIYSNNRENTLHATLISNIIAKSDIPDVQEINKIDRGKILIEVNSAAAANRLVEKTQSLLNITSTHLSLLLRY